MYAHTKPLPLMLVRACAAHAPSHSVTYRAVCSTNGFRLACGTGEMKKLTRRNLNHVRRN